MISRGSEWRLWDLHMHSTFSKEDRTKMSVKDIFDKLIENNISMFSITDHSNVDALDNIWDIYENQSNEKGPYKNQISFIPGIEIKTDKGKSGVHLICVFPLKLRIGEMIVKTTKQNLYDNFCAKLGLTTSEIEAKGEGNYGEGLLKAIVKFDDAVELTHKLGGLVIVHGGDKHGSIENEMKHVKSQNRTAEDVYASLDITKTDIIKNKIDVIELPNHNKKEAKNACFYKREFGKPCMIASDSHERGDYERCYERSTWVKADCSFEGLRQALIDYDNRIYLGVVPEQIERVKNNSTKFIKQLSIDWENGYDGNKGKWFKELNIPMNPGLVSIIGNKGNGKSAVAEVIGLLADSKNYGKFAFLNKNKFLKNRLAENFKATIVWENEECVTKKLSEIPDFNNVERCQCIPQQYFEEICTDTELKRFSDEINNVIFSRLSVIDKENCRNFDELINKYTKVADENIGFLISELTAVNRSIIEKEEKLVPSYREKEEALLKDACNQLNAHLAVMPKKVEMPELAKEKKVKYDLLIETIQNLDKKIETENQKNIEINEKIHTLQNVQAEIVEIKNRYDKSIDNIRIELSEFGIPVEQIFEIKIDDSAINIKIEQLVETITNIHEAIYNSDDGLVAQYEKALSEKNFIAAEESKHIQEYNDYLDNMQSWEKVKKEREDAVDSIQKEIQYLEMGIQQDLEPLYYKRDAIANDILKEKKKIVEIYNKFKKPVDDFLRDNQELLNDYSIFIRSGIVIDTIFQQTVFDYVNKQKRNAFKDDNYQLYKTVEEIGDIEEIDDYLNIPKAIIKKMNEFPDGILSQIKDGRLLDFYNYIYGLSYLTNKYELVSDDKTLEKLSPGERGALLLIFYLLLDLRDIPLVIDQPEDNLDNQSVAKVLVPFIRVAKTRRQIILVTHNPNLAVVADSDQIIHVRIDKEDAQAVGIEAGGIENDDINKSIVNILEGTMYSFKKREKKYIDYD